MESLQFAQILADLSDLQNTDPKPTTALLQANKTLLSQSQSPNHTHRKSATVLPPAQKFDRLGRRIVRTNTGGSGSGTSTPGGGGGATPVLGMSRMGSEVSESGSERDRERLSWSVGGSGTGTPRVEGGGAGGETDIDMTRARTLLELFEKRANFKQMGDTGLLRSKERVDAVVASYARKDLELKERSARARHLAPRS